MPGVGKEMRSTRERENGLCRGFFSEKGRFPFLAWEKSHLAGGRNRGSLNIVCLWPSVLESLGILLGSQGSMDDWAADLSPCNCATTHFSAERSSFILKVQKLDV